MAGMPVDVSADPTLEADDIYGVTFFPGPSITVRACAPKRVRERRALIHEVLHVIDEGYRLGLSHDQIRALATALDTTLHDSRNRRFFSL